MQKRVATITLAAALGLGGLGIAAVNPLGVAGAQDGTTSEGATEQNRDGALARALDSLVADGTLTQGQADEVLAATKAEAEAGKAERKERREVRRTATLQVIADAIGSTPDDVKAALADGTSVAAQAEAAGVDRQIVDDALTGHLTERIEAAVAEGRLSEDRAAKAIDHVDAAVDRILDADGSGRGEVRGDGRLRDRLRDRLGD